MYSLWISGVVQWAFRPIWWVGNNVIIPNVVIDVKLKGLCWALIITTMSSTANYNK